MKIRCKKCNDIIEGDGKGTYITCSCKACAIDETPYYTRVIGNVEDYEEYIDEEDESPYCEVCGTCGYIGCCAVDNFLEKHVKGKTNCKNESLMIEEISKYVNDSDNLYKENKELQQERDKYKNIVEEIGEMIFNSDTYIHYDENIEDHYIYESDLIDAYKYLLEELEKGE